MHGGCRGCRGCFSLIQVSLHGHHIKLFVQIFHTICHSEPKVHFKNGIQHAENKNGGEFPIGRINTKVKGDSGDDRAGCQTQGV